MFYSMGISLFFIHSTVDGHDLILPFDYGDYCCYENLYKIICLNTCVLQMTKMVCLITCVLWLGMKSEIYIVHDFMKLTFLSGNKNSKDN